MKHMTPEEAGQLQEAVTIVVEAAAPAILKAIAASRPGVQMCGELMVTEPVRDYRKELWIGALIAAIPTTQVRAAARDVADVALFEFDARFLK